MTGSGAHEAGMEVGSSALRDAVVEMTHAQGEGASSRAEGASAVSYTHLDVYKRQALTCPMLKSPKWNTLAASTASAPAATAGAKCSTAPAPPLAMMGIRTRSLSLIHI